MPAPVSVGGRRVVLCGDPGVPALGPSGASAHLRGIARALGAPIVCVEPVDRRGSGGASAVPIYAGGRAGWPTWAPRQGLREVRTARRCVDLAVRLRPDLVWERHALYSDAGWKVHAATGARWVLEVNAPLAEERARAGVLADPDHARGWERDLLLAAPDVVAVSTWLVDWLRDLGCTSVRHLPNGVEGHRGDRDQTRDRLGLGEAYVLVYVGSGRAWQGLDRLPALLDRLPHAVGLAVGDPTGVPAHPRLRALGQLDEPAVADVIAAADVGLAPYTAAAPPWFCPLKVLAYRAQGTPVVSADVGDARALVGDAGTVLGGTATDAAWAEAIDGWRGRRAAPEVRTWDQVAAEGLRPAS